jgi:choline kinase
MNNITAIILAAGTGNRLGELTKNKPKVLLEVNNKALVEYAIDFMKTIGAQDIIVVGGYLYQQLVDRVKSYDPKIQLAENKNYQEQNLLSLLAALLLASEANLLIGNSDYVFQDHTAAAISNNLNQLGVYASFDLSGDDTDVMKVKVDEEGNLVEMSKTLTDFQAIYIGYFYLPAEVAKELPKVAAQIIGEYGTKKSTVEYLFPALIKARYKIKVVDIGQADWLEIDTPEELAKAREILDNKTSY